MGKCSRSVTFQRGPPELSSAEGLEISICSIKLHLYEIIMSLPPSTEVTEETNSPCDTNLKIQPPSLCPIWSNKGSEMRNELA